MSDLIIPEPLADELREIAEQENQTVEEILKLLIQQYKFLTTEDDEETGWEEANAVLRERYARMRGDDESDEMTIRDEETIAKLRSSAAWFKQFLDDDQA